MKIKTYSEAVSYIESFVGKVVFKMNSEFVKQHDPLERMKVLLSFLGNPQKRFKSVLIGGTSGKGSTAYLTSHIITTSGYKTGLLVKPHIEKINERIQINNVQVNDDVFVQLILQVQPVVEKMEKMEIGAPSYFEILVAMAFLYFASQKVDIAVVEVGMGGEFDATNTLNPLIAVITNVSFDHTDYLGKTVQKIAKTKAGIIKRIQNPLIIITGAKQQSVIKIIEAKCQETGAKLYKLNTDFFYRIYKEDVNGSIFTYRDKGYRSPKFYLRLLGAHQVENAAVALSTVFCLVQFGFTFSDHDILQAFETAFFPGRFEVMTSRFDKLPTANYLQPVTIVLDGAHNSEKMRAFLKTLKKFYKTQKKIFVIAFKKDKHFVPLLKQIFAVADVVFVTQFAATTDFAKSMYASVEIESIKKQIESIKKKKTSAVFYVGDSKKALEKARKLSTAEENSIIAVTGSLYLVGEVRKIITLAK